MIRALSLMLIMFLAALGLGAPRREALIFGCDTYAFKLVTPTALKLSGTENDARQMRMLLEAYRFDVCEFLQKACLRTSIQRWLDDEAKAAKPGDEFVIYFSGRGSMAPDPTGSSMLLPTLVPYDADPSTGRKDVLIASIEAFSRKLPTGTRFTLVVDASFVAKEIPKGFEDRPWKPAPRALVRAGADASRLREQVYLGKGVALVATKTTGAAFETQKSVENDAWGGAFTDYLFSRSFSAFLGREILSGRDAAGDFLAYFSALSRQDYLTEQIPPRVGLEADRQYDRPLFSESLPEVDGKYDAIATQLQAERVDRSKNLYIAVDFSPPKIIPPEGWPRAKWQKASDELKAELASLPNVKVVDRHRVPDRVIRIIQIDPLQVSLGVGQVSSLDDNSFGGSSTRDLISKSGIVTRLRSVWLQLKLFRIGLKDHPLEGFNASLPKSVFVPGDELRLNVSLPEPARVFFLIRDDCDGFVEVSLPRIEAPFNRYDVGPSTVPAPNTPAPWFPTPDQPNPAQPGRSVTLMIAIPAQVFGDITLPGVEPDPSSGELDEKKIKEIQPEFDRKFLAMLEAATAYLESPDARFATKKLTFEVRT